MKMFRGGSENYFTPDSSQILVRSAESSVRLNFGKLSYRAHAEVGACAITRPIPLTEFLDMDEATRSVKRNKFGGMKYVYSWDTMKRLCRFFEGEMAKRFRVASVLYWT